MGTALAFGNYVWLDGRFFNEQSLALGLGQDQEYDLACMVGTTSCLPFRSTRPQASGQ